MGSSNFKLITQKHAVPIKAWIGGLPLEEVAERQLQNLARLPIIHHHVAVMPDVHWGIGATVGSVIPTVGAIIPAAVGVDIGCGMMAAKTSLLAKDLPENLRELRGHIEQEVPHGRTHHGGRGDRGALGVIPEDQRQYWKALEKSYQSIIERHPKIRSVHINHVNHLGTLGTGNHFIEICLDESDSVWLMLHSGSRGVGNRLGTYFIELAKQDMRKNHGKLPDQDLAYFREGSKYFQDYVDAVSWAQSFAKSNRELIMQGIVRALKKTRGIPPFETDLILVNCHHNYVSREFHFGKEVFLTRKGALRARVGDFGIIPGSMGACSYIVEGLGNPESFESCSHGSGRLMSRSAAKRRFTLEDHERATAGVECRKDRDVIDETPGAYKPIDRVMRAQSDLVKILYTLKQVVCVKG